MFIPAMQSCYFRPLATINMSADLTYRILTLVELHSCNICAKENLDVCKFHKKVILYQCQKAVLCFMYSYNRLKLFDRLLFVLVEEVMFYNVIF